MPNFGAGMKALVPNIGDLSHAERCADWESCLLCGPIFFDDLAHHRPVGDVSDRYSEFVILVKEAWPAVREGIQFEPDPSYPVALDRYGEEKEPGRR